MPTKVKRGGAYIDPLAIKIKRGGIYVDPIAISVKRGGVYQNIWPNTVDPTTKYKVVGNRTRSPTASSTLSTAIEQMNWIYLGFFPFAPYAFQALYPMHYTTSDNIEHAAANPMTFRGWSIAYSSTKDVNTTTRVLGTVADSTAAFTIDPAVNSVGFVTNDLITQGQIPINQHIWIMQAFATASGGSICSAYDFSPTSTLEGAIGSGTSQVSKLTSGTLSAVGANGSASNYGPSVVYCKGNPNKVALGWGDSILWGANESLYTATDGKFGGFSRGMAMGTEMFAANMAIPGSSLGYWVDNGRAGVSKKLDLLKLAPQIPFDVVVTNHFTNGFGTGGTGYANLLAKYKAFVANMNAEWPGIPIHQILPIAKLMADTDGLTTVSGQTASYPPGSTQQQLVTKMIADNVDGVIQGTIDWRSAFGASTDVTKWNVNTWSGTVATGFDYAANAATIRVASATPLTNGFGLILAPLGAGSNPVVSGGRTLKNVTNNGDGTYTATLPFGWSYLASAGTAVQGVDTIDTIHPCADPCKRAAVYVDAYKSNF